MLGLGSEPLDGIQLGPEHLKKPGILSAFRQTSLKPKSLSVATAGLAADLASQLRLSHRSLPWTGAAELAHLTKAGLRRVAEHLQLSTEGHVPELLSRIGSSLSAAGATPHAEWAGHTPHDYLAEAEQRAARTHKRRKIGKVAYDVRPTSAPAALSEPSTGPGPAGLPGKVVVATLHAGGCHGNVFHLPGPDAEHPTMCGALHKTLKEHIRVVDTQEETVVQRFSLRACEKCVQGERVLLRRGGAARKRRPAGRTSTTRKDREKIVELCIYSAVSVAQCAKETGWSERTISKVLHDYREQGDDALLPKARAKPAPRKLTKEHKRALDQVSCVLLATCTALTCPACAVARAESRFDQPPAGGKASGNVPGEGLGVDRLSCCCLPGVPTEGSQGQAQGGFLATGSGVQARLRAVLRGLVTGARAQLLPTLCVRNTSAS